MYPSPPTFPCPLPACPALPCPLLPALCCPAFPCPRPCSPPCPPCSVSLAHLLHCACSCRFPPRALYPLLLPARFAASHSVVLPPAGCGTPPLHRRSAQPVLPLTVVRHRVGCFALLLSPPDHIGPATFPSRTPSPAGRWFWAPALEPGGDCADAPCAPAPRTAPFAGGAPPSPPLPAPLRSPDGLTAGSSCLKECWSCGH